LWRWLGLFWDGGLSGNVVTGVGKVLAGAEIIVK
jgi:hypothetical protein